MDKSNKFILGIFEDEEILLNAVKTIRDQGEKIHDVYSPFPVHGMEKILGVKNSRIPIAAFIIGAIFCLLTFGFQWWVSEIDYPINFGGKPLGAFLSFIPPTFEITVLTTSVGMAILLFVLCELIPSTKQHPIDLKITDNRFIIAFKVEESTDISKIRKLLNESCTIEIKEIEK